MSDEYDPLEQVTCSACGDQVAWQSLPCPINGQEICDDCLQRRMQHGLSCYE